MRVVRKKGQRVAITTAMTVLFVAALLLQAIPADAAPGDPISTSAEVSAIVDPAFMFSVTGMNSGSCNGTAVTGTGSTASAISLGRVDKTNSAVGGQQLSVASNAGGGYTVFAHVDGPLSDGAGHTISTLGSTNTNPSVFVAPGTEGFGYTTDSLLQGAVPDRFIAGGAKWSGIDLNDREVMYGPNATDASTNCVVYQITISENTVGGYYGNNVTYTAVPTF